jgi:hypothetical protein
MKKVIFRILGAAVCMAALLLNVSLNKNKSVKDTNLLAISVATEVNAECRRSPANNGRCSYFLSCFADPFGGVLDCDTLAGY